MALGLLFRGGAKKSMSPVSRAQARQSTRGGVQKPAGMDRHSMASPWQRGQGTNVGQPRPSIFFGAPITGSGRTSAPASPLDILTGRGKYMEKFQQQRKEIVHNYLKDKSKELAKWRRLESHLRKDLRERDEDMYREYKIAKHLRPEPDAAADASQEKLIAASEEKVMERFKENKREALVGLQKARDRQVKEMKEQLRENHDSSFMPT